MLRKLLGLTVATAMMGLVAGSAQAGVFQPLSSELQLQIAGLPTITVTGSTQNSGWATVSNNGVAHDLTDSQSVWQTSGLTVGTSLLTGVSLLTNLGLTATNQTGSFTASFSTPNFVGGNLTTGSTPYSGTLCPNGGCLGGTEGFTGRFILGAPGGPYFLDITGVLGVGGTASLVIGNPTTATPIVVTAMPFVTGKARITNVNTNVIQMPDRGASGVTGIALSLQPAATENVRTFTVSNGFVTGMTAFTLKTQNTVTVGGSNALGSASAAGVVTLISPFRIDTGNLGLGNLPGYATKTYVFVPEPGTVLLLVSGAAGLIFIGRKRMKG